MEGIEGDKSHLREIYKQECSRGVTLFQKSLAEFQKSEMPAQKEEFKHVMEKALHIIHETATQCLSKEMQKEEIQLEKDYKNYIDDPSLDNLKKLNRDLQHFQKEI